MCIFKRCMRLKMPSKSRPLLTPSANLWIIHLACVCVCLRIVKFLTSPDLGRYLRSWSQGYKMATRWQTYPDVSLSRAWKKDHVLLGCIDRGSSSRAPPQILELISLVSGQGFCGGFKGRGGDNGSILTHLLNSPSSTSSWSGTSSVGKVLVDVLIKVNKKSFESDPNRAESLRNLANNFSEKERVIALCHP